MANILNIKNSDIAIFKVQDKIFGEILYLSGNIINTFYKGDKQYFSICYLDGYSSRVEDVTKDHLIAIVDKLKEPKNYCDIFNNNEIEYSGYFKKIKDYDTIIFYN